MDISTINQPKALPPRGGGSSRSSLKLSQLPPLLSQLLKLFLKKWNIRFLWNIIIIFDLRLKMKECQLKSQRQGKNYQHHHHYWCPRLRLDIFMIWEQLSQCFGWKPKLCWISNEYGERPDALSSCPSWPPEIVRAVGSWRTFMNTKTILMKIIIRKTFHLLRLCIWGTVIQPARWER